MDGRVAACLLISQLFFSNKMVSAENLDFRSSDDISLVIISFERDSFASLSANSFSGIPTWARTQTSEIAKAVWLALRSSSATSREVLGECLEMLASDLRKDMLSERMTKFSLLLMHFDMAKKIPRPSALKTDVQEGTLPEIEYPLEFQIPMPTLSPALEASVAMMVD